MILRRTDDISRLVRDWQAAGDVVGVVPTMGALHDGHLSLVRKARADCDRVIVTIFVNPRQFNRSEDLASYPRDEEADAAALAPFHVDAIFAPPPEEVYPPGFASAVSVGGVAVPLEGALRPGHFDGVATVVTKLFGMTRAERAYFGEKDWQQLQVVRQLTADLNLGVTVVGCPTLRETSGLAMSSRNRRLSPEAHAVAPGLYIAMREAAAAIGAGQSPAAALPEARARLLKGGFERVEYIVLRDAETLADLTDMGRPARLLAAAWLEGVRLIDNIAVPPDEVG